CNADERGLHIADGGIKAQGCCRNDAKRTLGAYEKLFQVITGRVFPQRAQTIPDTAIRQYDLEAQNLVSRRAIAQNIDTSCIGGKVSSNLATTFRSQA